MREYVYLLFIILQALVEQLTVCYPEVKFGYSKILVRHKITFGLLKIDLYGVKQDSAT